MQLCQAFLAFLANGMLFENRNENSKSTNNKKHFYDSCTLQKQAEWKCCF